MFSNVLARRPVTQSYRSTGGEMRSPAVEHKLKPNSENRRTCTCSSSEARRGLPSELRRSCSTSTSARTLEEASASLSKTITTPFLMNSKHNKLTQTWLRVQVGHTRTEC